MQILSKVVLDLFVWHLGTHVKLLKPIKANVTQEFTTIWEGTHLENQREESGTDESSTYSRWLSVIINKLVDESHISMNEHYNKFFITLLLLDEQSIMI